ncbi:cytochrome c family protein [Pacificibacter sp. AS14]|uniref:c-type cytochrome n=1 Tax=Pacificibacter sp. AS14 TaxID=3135785 RepID=UPI003178346D
MFDTMTLTKAVSAICGTLLFFLFGSWAAEALYHTGGGHGDHAQAYVIEVEDSAPVEEAVAVDFGPILAAADPASGESIFGKKCSACHTVTSADKTGPHLNGAFNRDIGSIAGFGYSGVLTELEGNWTADALNHFLEKPKGFAPGTKMTFAGFKKIDDRADVIAYLQSLGS